MELKLSKLTKNFLEIDEVVITFQEFGCENNKSGGKYLFVFNFSLLFPSASFLKIE